MLLRKLARFAAEQRSHWLRSRPRPPPRSKCRQAWEQSSLNSTPKRRRLRSRTSCSTRTMAFTTDDFHRVIEGFMIQGAVSPGDMGETDRRPDPQ